MRDPGGDQRGFTLIELLVVIVIIAILAAIAIPVYLRQRNKAWDAAAESDLKNLAVAEMTYLHHAGTFTSDMVTLGTATGYESTVGVAIVFAYADATGFEATATSGGGGVPYCVSSVSSGIVKAHTC